MDELSSILPPMLSTRAQKDSTSFFEKKKQKTFAQLASAFPRTLSLNLSKFFGSFFQKRTAFFAAFLPWMRSPYLGSYKKETKNFCQKAAHAPCETIPTAS
jgi:hypothetical protein